MDELSSVSGARLARVGRKMGRSSVLAAMALLVALLGCKRFSSKKEEDKPYVPPPSRVYSIGTYASLCDKGAEPFGSAKEYKKGTDAAKPSKVAVFTKYLDDKTPRYKQSSPDAMKPLLADRPDEVELVACLEMKRSGKPGVCSYTYGKLERYDMSHTLRVLEAKTGKVVHEEKFELETGADSCPDTYSFAKGVSKYYSGPDFGPRLLSSFLPLEPDGVELPNVKAGELDTVCGGSPVPQAAAYDKSADKRWVHNVYFPSEEMSKTVENRPKGIPRQRDRTGNASEYQLVACITGQPKTKKRECKFMNGNVLELYDGEVEVAVYEAKTAKLVEKKTFKATSRRCPTFHTFWGRRDPYLENVEPGLEKYVKDLEGK